ncbi:citrate synthase/methylcitrate synthase [Halobacteriales archaeon SW_7_68_16]|nr:MAG: citrate synthase/methylcitrate synthase [Halobacteriales archaeon SW_7_68_16]
MGGDDTTPGLDDAIAAETRLSRIDGETGDLVVAGYPLSELAGRATAAEVLFVLLHDRLPTRPELDDLRDRLATARTLPAPTRSLLRAAGDAGADPTAALRTGLASLDATGESVTDPVRVVGAVPAIVGTYWRARRGLTDAPPTTDADRGQAAALLRLVTDTDPDPDHVDALETYLVALAEHGLDAPTLAARTVVSTGSDLLSAVTAATGALAGDRHGGAPGPVLDLLDATATDGAESVLRERLEAGKRLHGFGHRVYRTRDPRAAVVEATAAALVPPDRLAHVREVERVGTDLLADRYPDRTPATNVEFWAAVLLDGIGLPRPLFTSTFATARVAGWAAHAAEQRASGRLLRPRSRYVGATGRTWTPIERRYR